MAGHRRVRGIIIALVAFSVAGCGGSGGVTPTSGLAPQDVTHATTAASPAASASPTTDDAEALAEGRAPSDAQADTGYLTVSPKSLHFTSSSPQIVSVSVTGKTLVFAGSTNKNVATVSPSVQEVRSRSGGTLTFTITPQTTTPAKTLVCFIDAQWHYACVQVMIGTATPAPTATPTMAPTPAPFVYSPASPYSATIDEQAQLTVSEAGYTGGFTVTGATASNGATCSPSYNFGYVCTTPDSSGVQIDATSEDPAATTSFTIENHSAGPDPAFSATFTFADQNNHTSSYTVNVPATN